MTTWNSRALSLPLLCTWLALASTVSARSQADSTSFANPLAIQTYLKASNTESGEFFGRRVAISGDTIVVGSPGEDSSATVVDGNQGDNSAGDAGAAYVFVKTPSGWVQEAYLKPSNADASDSFGYDVAIDGDIIAISAPNEDSSATGVNGNQTDNSYGNAGAAYVFERVGTTWSQTAYLKASNTSFTDNFGSSIAISGDTIAVGAHGEDSSAPGVNGDESLNNALWSGAAYVFVRDRLGWTQQAYVKSSNPEQTDRFGFCLDISGDTLVVGAWSEDSSAAGVNGDHSLNDAPNSGAAYVFVRNGTTWTQEAYLKASNSDPGDYFGDHVAVNGDTVAVSASLEQSGATGIDGDQLDNGIDESGAVYVFERGSTTWSQTAYVKASNPGIRDLFGYSLDVHGPRLVVGSIFEDSVSTGINGDEQADWSRDSGAVYLFELDQDGWAQIAYIKAGNNTIEDYFGNGVALSADHLLAGAYFEDGGSTGVNGDVEDDSEDSAGAAYIIRLPLPLAVCSERNGSGVNPTGYTCQSVPRLGDMFFADIPLGQTTMGAVIAVGLGGPFSGFFAPNGELLIAPPYLFAFSGNGTFTFSLPPDPTLIGTTLSTQGVRIESMNQRVWLNAIDLTFGL